jgi:hypothetical protein
MRRQRDREAARLEAEEDVAGELQPGPEPRGRQRPLSPVWGEPARSEHLARLDVHEEPRIDNVATPAVRAAILELVEH